MSKILDLPMSEQKKREVENAQSINNIYLGKAEVVLIINALNTAPLPNGVLSTKNALVKKLLEKGKARR